MTKHIHMNYSCKSCSHIFLPINLWRMCPKCGVEADGVFPLAEEVYSAGRYHRETHYGAGSHMPKAWMSGSYGDKVAPWGFRLFDYLYFSLSGGRPTTLEKYLMNQQIPDGREGDYYRALLQSFYDIFVLFESPLK